MSAFRRFSLTRAVSAFTVTALLCGPFAALPALANDPVPAPDAAPEAVTLEKSEGQQADRIIVKFRDAARSSTAKRGEAYDEAAKDAGVDVTELRTTASGATVVQANRKLTSEEAAKTAAALDAQPTVEYAEVDAFLRPAVEAATAGPADDEYYGLQWALHEDTAGMRTPGAWARSTGTGQVIAVIDTGITAHNDLVPNLVPGYDFITDPGMAGDGDGRDPDNTDVGDSCQGGASSWHGTHVAGTIGAVSGSSAGVVGVAYGAKVQPIRALGSCGGYTSDVADALSWAVGGSISGLPMNRTPADVVNLSLGHSGICGTTFQSALNFAAEQLATVVVSAGNKNSPAAGQSPANCEKVITVGATGREGNKAGYSNYGPAVDVSAPGGDFSSGASGGILSTYNSGFIIQGAENYAYMQGTSMAAPHVAGVAALMRSAAPSLTPVQIEEKLKKAARPLPGTCYTGECGAGLVDAAAAVRAANPALLEFSTRPELSVEGAAVVGNRLSVAHKAESWSPVPDSLSYQWRRGTTAIAGATSAAYTITQADVGARLSLTITVKKFDYTTLTQSTAPTGTVVEQAVTPAPEITGTPRVGTELTAVPGTWTPGPVTFQYQWLSGTNPIAGATSQKYTPVAVDVGKNLSVRVTGSGPGLAETSVLSKTSVPVAAGTLVSSVPNIGGTVKVGSTLTAWSGTWSFGTTRTYQWYRSGTAVIGATASKYVLRSADLGKAMSVRVTGSKPGYTTASRISAKTAAVAAGTLSGSTPWISGYQRVGNTLTANTGTWTSGAAFKYQWYRSGVAIVGASGKSYRLVSADRNDRLRVRVFGSKAGYTSLTKSSALTNPIP